MKNNLSAGYCIEKEPRNMAEYLIRQGIVLGLPVIITLATTIISLPGLFRCVSNTSFLLRPRADKEGLGLLRKTPSYDEIKNPLISFFAFNLN